MGYDGDETMNDAGLQGVRHSIPSPKHCRYVRPNVARIVVMSVPVPALVHVSVSAPVPDPVLASAPVTALVRVSMSLCLLWCMCLLVPRYLVSVSVSVCLCLCVHLHLCPSLPRWLCLTLTDAITTESGPNCEVEDATLELEA